MTSGGSLLLAELFDEVEGAALEFDDPAPAIVFDPFTMPAARAARPVTIPEPPAAPKLDLPSHAELAWASATTIATLVSAGRLSADGVRAALLERVRRLNPALNAFVHVGGDVDSGDTAVPAGPLTGVPVGVKDLIDVAGLPTTNGAMELSTQQPAVRDARCWALLRAAGAQLLGKLNTQEFAAGVTGDNDRFGPATNPWSAAHIAGGSSSGSAVAVAAGLVPLALGTDTGGSIRIPASCCGVVGLKPTFGRVPVDGVKPLAWSLDHVGPLSRSVVDAALAFDVLAGGRCASAARAGAAGLVGVRVGVPVEWIASVTPEVADVYSCAIATLRGLGAEVLEVTRLPTLQQIVAVNRVIAFAEGSAAHAAHLARGFAYGAAVRARMHAGHEIRADTYLAAQRMRRLICAQLGRAWADVDVLVTPTLPCTAPRRGSATVRIDGDEVPLGLALVRFTAAANLTGQPALTVPAHTIDGGLPVGLMVTAPVGEDALACFVGGAYESAVPAARPPRLACVKAP